MKRLIFFLFLLPLIAIGQVSDIFSKTEITEIYSQAIADFIKTIDARHKSKMDTLYFGKHIYGQPDDFPDIELPKTIENTQIRLVTPEIGLKKQQASKSLVYINMVGWVDKEKIEFVFVVFSNGREHQYDFFINYIYDSKRMSYKKADSRIEYYLYKNKR